MNDKLSVAGLQKLPPSNDHDEETLGFVTVQWFSNPVDVHVIFRMDDAESGPTDQQIDAFCQFMRDQETFFESIEKIIFDHFNEARDESDYDESVTNELFPVLDSPRNLAEKTELTGILVGYFNGEWSSNIGLLAECSWDEDDGLGVEVVDGIVTKIGPQNIVI